MRSCPQLTSIWHRPDTKWKICQTFDGSKWRKKRNLELSWMFSSQKSFHFDIDQRWGIWSSIGNREKCENSGRRRHLSLTAALRRIGSRLGVYTASLIPSTHQNYITCGWIQSVRISLAPPSAASQVMRWMSSAESANQIWFPEGSHEGFSVTISLFGGERRRMADLILIQSLTQDSVLDNQLQMERELLWHQLVNSEQFDWSWIKSRQHSPFVFVTEQFLRLLRPAAIFLRLIDKREQLQSVLILDPARSNEEWDSITNGSGDQTEDGDYH